MLGRYWVVLSVWLLAFSANIVAAEEPLEHALRATFRITQGNTSGTAFVVALDEQTGGQSQLLVVTAAHTFEKMPGAKCALVCRTAAEGTYKRKEVELTIRDGDKPRWVRHPEMDVAVLAVELPEGLDLQPLPYRQIADEQFAKDRKIRVGQEVFVPCFPAKLEVNSAGWPVLRKGAIATHPLTPLSAAKTALVDYSHFGGDSGAPVVAVVENEPHVVGLVFAMQRQSDTISTPFEERTVHTPLGLALIVQSPLIRETIDLWRAKQ